MTFHPIPEDRDAWLALRTNNLGASEVAALFGMQASYAPGIYALWQTKAGRHTPDPIDNARTAWGLRLEDAIAAAAAEREGWRVLPGQFVTHDQVGGMSCTLDRIIAEPGPEERERGWQGPGVLELKNVDWLTHRAKWGDEPPAHILLQLQHQLACTGYAWGAFAALVGGNDLRVYRYQRRPKLIAKIEAAVEGFWASIRANRPPAPDGSEATTRAIRDEIGDRVDEEPADLRADNEAPDICARLLDAQRRRKEAEAEEDECKNRLLAKVGEHKWAKVQGFRVSRIIRAETPDRTITPEMVGTTIKGRRGSVSITVKEFAA